MTVLIVMVRMRFLRSRAFWARRISSMRALRAVEAAFLLVLLMETRSLSPQRRIVRAAAAVGEGWTG
jgi:hypothetical protein